MNLNELRNKVKAITDYSPELAVYNEQLDLLINDAYNALWTERRWTFATKTTFLDIWPDIVPTQIGTGVVVNATVTNNSRRVTFSAAVHALDIPYIWEGQVFEVDSRDYTILKVVSPTDIRLDTPFRGTSSATNKTWKIKHRFYEPPKDAIELLYIGHRDTPATGSNPPYGKVGGLLPRRDEDYGLREDLTAEYSECYIPVGTANIPPAETLGLTVGANDSGTFGAGYYYELCWAFESAGGKLGPLSEPKIIKTLVTMQDPTSIVVSFKSFDDIPVRAPTFVPGTDQTVNPYEGLRKRIFFNQNFNRSTGVRITGLPVWRDVTLGASAVVPGMPGFNTATDPVRVSDEVEFFAILGENQFNPGNKRYEDWDGLHMRFRPYPRPIGSDFQYPWLAGVGGETPFDAGTERQFRQWEVRYYRKPGMLALQTDQPEMPHEFHGLIVYKALADIFSKHDNAAQANTYERKYAVEIKRLEKRYVNYVDVSAVRGQFGVFDRGYSPYDASSLRKLP